MVYSKQTWTDNAPPPEGEITAARLAYMEEGIQTAQETADGIPTQISTPGSAVEVALSAAYVPAVMVVGTGIDPTGSADSTAAIQAKITAAPSGAVIYFPEGTYKITTALAITKSLTILGASRWSTMVTAYAVDAFTVSAGVHHVIIERLGINTSVAYTTTTNTLTGIKVSGTAGSACAYHTYRDLWIQGFRTAIQTTSIWSSRFDNVHTAYGLLGIDAYGLSENNIITNCNIVVGDGTMTRLTGSKCIALNGQVSPADATATQSEGWVIANNAAIAGGDVLIDFLGVTHCTVIGNLLDFAHLYSIHVAHNGAANGGDIKISDNYMAMAGDAAATGGLIEIASAAGATRSVLVAGNQLVGYSGAGTRPYGIRVAATHLGAVQIAGNTISGFTTADIWLDTGGHAVSGNQCLSNTGNQIVGVAGMNLISDNLAVVYIAGGTAPNTYSLLGSSKVCSWTAAPSSGTWAKADRVVNSNPAAGSPKGWVCTVAGTSGTWVSEGNL